MKSDLEFNAGSYDEHAVAWEEALKTNVAHKYMEKPAMEKLLPEDLSGKRVLCIGVGSGDEIREILRRGAVSVVGVDISEKLLDFARAKFPEVDFQKLDMHDVGKAFEKESFDIVYSSLAFHYSSNWDALLAGVYHVLKQNGLLIFSTHHPDFWGKRGPDGTFVENERGIKLTRHKAMLPGNTEVIFYNHPNKESIVEALEHVGFKNVICRPPEVTNISTEQKSSMQTEELEGYEKLYEKNPERPLFLVVRAEK